MQDPIQFTYKQVEYTLSRAQVIAAVAGLAPKRKGSAKHLVVIEDVEFPINQAFAAAIGISRASTSLQVSIDKLSKLGFVTTGPE